ARCRTPGLLPGMQRPPNCMSCKYSILQDDMWSGLHQLPERLRRRPVRSRSAGPPRRHSGAALDPPHSVRTVRGCNNAWVDYNATFGDERWDNHPRVRDARLRALPVRGFLFTTASNVPRVCHPSKPVALISGVPPKAEGRAMKRLARSSL